VLTFPAGVGVGRHKKRVYVGQQGVGVTYPSMVPRLLRRILVPALAVFVVVAVAASVLAVGVTRRSFPQTEGEVTVSSLQGQVDVLRDAQGVPHIYADTSADLFRAQGFVAAQDRFFQMDMRRHITAGRLSEMVGPGAIETDTVIRTMGWRRVAEEELGMLDSSTRQYLRAYSAGVNDYLADKSPSQISLEYVVLGQSVPLGPIEKWDEVDSLAWLKAMAWDLRGNYEDELARARLAGSVTPEQLDDLYPDYPFDTNAPILSSDEWEPGPKAKDALKVPAPPAQGTDSSDESGPSEDASSPSEDVSAIEGASAEVAYGRTLGVLDQIPQLIADGEGVGSNSWVVSGEHTESGKPLLANDPHIGVTQPSVWSQVGLHCREISDACPFDVTGFTFAGMPGVIIGHNQSIAWGFTNLDPDVTDFYLEDTSGETYLRDGEMVPVTTRPETISVAGGTDVDILVRSTVHGPILSDVLDPVAQAGINPPVEGAPSGDRYAVSMAWTGLVPARTADAVFMLNAATDWDTFREAAANFAVPAQNMVYADAEGNIGYQAPGMVPIRTSATPDAPPGYWPAPGWDSAYDWQGFVPFDSMPTVLNPEDGVIVAANQALTEFDEPFLTSEWDKGYRAQRIADLLATEMAAGPLTIDSMERIQYDTFDTFADTLLPYLLDANLGTDPFYAKPVELLESWNRSAPKGNSEQGNAAMFYYAIWASLLDLTIDEELPLDIQEAGSSRSMQVMSILLEDPENAWWDDQRTPGVIESRDTIIKMAMTNARLQLTEDISKNPDDWRWGALHSMTARHQVLGDDPSPGLVQSVFNVGPFPMPGGSSLVNANNWDAGEDSFSVTSAPSMRMVVDLDDLDDSVWINQGGNSGHAFHPNYDDQTQPWIDGESYSWPYSPGAVKDAAEATLSLVPRP